MNEEFVIGRSFGTADYIVFGALIAISIAIGIFFAIKDKRHNTSVNYFLGDRKLKSFPLGLSFVATFLSSITMLGSPAEVYVYGLQYAMQIIGIMGSLYLASAIVVPLLHPLKLTSVYEYYQLRYGTKSVRCLGVVLGVSYYTLYMGIVLFGTALALQSTTALPIWISVVTFAAAATLYTSIGGIKAVIWTDVFQSFVMLGGILAVIIKSTTSAGGPTNVVQAGKDRFNFFNFNPDPTIRHTFWTLVIGAISQYFYPTITQAGVQRIMSTSHPNTARRMLYLAVPVYCTVWVLVMFEGLSVFAYHSLRGCDPLASGQISNPNQIIPFTILELFHNLHGIPGLFIAAVAAASLSTISSGLSGAAAITCVDILKVLKPNINDQKSTKISKLFVVMYGIISALIAFVLSNVKGPLGEIFAGFTGAVAGPQTGMFLVSVFFRRSRPKAVFFATCVSLAVCLWLIFGHASSSDMTRTPYLPPGPTDQCPTSKKNGSYTIYLENTQTVNTSTVSTTWSSTATKAMESKQLSGLKVFYSISYMYFHLIGTIITIIVAVIGSIVPLPTQQRRAMVEERCVLPLTVLVPPVCIWLYYKCRRKEKVKQNVSDEGENEDMLKEEKCTSI